MNGAGGENNNNNGEIPVQDLTKNPESSLLEQDRHVPVKINGIAEVEKAVCVSVTVGRREFDGSMTIVRKELLKTSDFKKRWPQTLLKFYEERATLNGKPLKY